MDNLKKEKQKELSHWITWQNRIMVLVGIMLISFFYLLYKCIETKQHIQLIIIEIFLFIIIGIINGKINTKKEYCSQYIQVIEQYERKRIKQLDGFDTGMDISHSMSLEDLHIVGEYSLFQYMNIAKSKQGKEKLIQRFQNTTDDLDLYHLYIDGLVDDPNWLIEFELNLQDIDYSSILSILIQKHQDSRYLIIDLLLDCITIISSVIFVFQSHYIASLSVMMVHYLFTFIYQNQYISYFKEYQQVSKLLESMMQISYKKGNNQEIEKLLERYFSYFSKKKDLQKINMLYALNDNMISSFIGNAFFSLRLLVVYYINKTLELDKLSEFIDLHTTLECLISLGTIPLCNQEITLPDKGEVFHIQDGYNPLINHCIANSFYYNQSTIITGSNMSGKTSFLRMIGINLILMNAGTYVFASSMTSPIYQVFTSINVQDDLQNGISTFYGELLRMKEAKDYQGNKAVLIDEIFKGTNYQDRLFGAKQMISQLSNNHTLLMITTHDFELCDQKNVDNYYFQESYKNDAIYFDYLIYPGKSHSTNAIYLMEKLELI